MFDVTLNVVAAAAAVSPKTTNVSDVIKNDVCRFTLLRGKSINSGGGFMSLGYTTFLEIFLIFSLNRSITKDNFLV